MSLTKIVVDGREYKSPDEMPSDVRQIYDRAMGGPQQAAGPADNRGRLHFAFRFSVLGPGDTGTQSSSPGGGSASPTPASRTIMIAQPQAPPAPPPAPIEAMGGQPRAGVMIAVIVCLLAAGLALWMILRR